jgi:uncharacterized membrane protein
VVGGNAWRWQNGFLTRLVGLDHQRYLTTGVSADGSVIVGTYGYTRPGTQFLWRWEGGTYTDLERPPGAESVWFPKLSGTAP